MARKLREHESARSGYRVTAVIALAVAGSLWGTAFLFGKIAFREMSVSTNVALRFCFGSRYFCRCYSGPPDILRDVISGRCFLAASSVFHFNF